MKIKIYSDIHLEFKGEMHPGKGDVLILAGDICTAKHYATNGELGAKYKKFFATCAKNFRKVFYVVGNHEYYGSNFQSVINKLRLLLPRKIDLLEKNAVNYNGVWFLGTTMWTDFDGNNAITMMNAGYDMNDYHTIAWDRSRKLQPKDILQEHNASRNWLMNEVKGKENVIVITHHAPTYYSTRAYGPSKMNGAYASKLDDFILNNPQIKYWVHGHTHSSAEYDVGTCKVICNPCGYPFEPNYHFSTHNLINLNDLVGPVEKLAQIPLL